MRLARRRFLIVGTAAALLVLVAGYAALATAFPALVRRGIADWQAQVPDLRVSLDAVSFDPWSWTLQAQGLAVQHAGRPLIRVDGLEVGLRLASLWRRAILIDEVLVRGASLDLRWDERGHLDVERILPHRPRHRVAGQDGSAARWQIDHLAVTALKVKVVDPAIGLADALELSLPSLELDHFGTLRGDEDNFVLNLHGRYDGQSVWDLHWQGDVGFAPLSSEGHVEISHLSLPWLARSLGRRWPLLVRQGQADLSADYQLSEVDGQQRLLVQQALLDVQQLRVAGKAAPAPEFSLRQLHAQAAAIDSLRRRVTGKDLLLDAPALTVHRGEDGQWDLLQLLRQWPRSSPAPAPSAWSVSWPLAELRSASVRVEDRSPQGLGDWRMPDVELQVENLQTQDDTPMQMTAHGPGLGAGEEAVSGRWSLSGRLQPRSGALRFSWQLQELDLAMLESLLQGRGGLHVLQGQAAAQGSIEGNLHRMGGLVAKGQAQVRRFGALAQGLGQLQGGQLDLGPARLAAGRLQLDKLAAQALHVSQGDRSLDLAALDAVDLSADLQGPSARVQALQMTGMKWNGGAVGAARLGGRQDTAALQGLRWDGARRRIACDWLRLGKGAAALQDRKRKERLVWDELRLDGIGGDLAAQELSLASLSASGWQWQGSQPWAEVPALEMQGFRVQLGLRRIALESAVLRDGKVLLLRGADGTIGPVEELQSVLGSGASAGHAQAPPGQGARHDWQFAVQSAQLGLAFLQWRDKRRSLPDLEAANLVLQTGAWSSAGGQIVPAHLEFSLGAGRVQWDGTLGLQPLAAEGRLAVQDAGLQPLQALLAQASFAGIDRGSISTSGRLSLRGPPQALQVHYEGAMQLGETRFVDLRSHDPILSWNHAEVPQMRLDWPAGLQIGRIEMDGLNTKFIVEADHRANWEALLRPRPAPAAAAEPGAASGAGAGAGPAWPVHIEQLVLTQAGAEFSDRSLHTPFEADIHGLSGIIGPFASDAPQAWTGMQFKGRVNDFGRVDVSGRVLPMSKPLRAEFSLHFGNIDMPALNPYAAEFAGYRIDQGMLDLRLQYTLDEGRIDGSNHARIDQLILGPQVRSEGVPDLALRAVIDVLRNDDGVIELDIPVQGDLNEPSVTLREIVFKALEGTLRSALEAPFRFVANLLGSDEETLRHISFGPGAAALSAHDQDKLKAIAQVLSSRQQLLLFIRPGFHPEADATGRQASAASPDSAKLRALAMERAKAIKEVLVKSGIKNHRILIDEPASLTALGKSGGVPTTLDLKLP
jgi:hypothetical protein